MVRRRGPVLAMGAVCALAVAATGAAPRRGAVVGWLEAKRDTSRAAPSAYLVGLRDQRGPVADPDGLPHRWLVCGGLVEEDRANAYNRVVAAWVALHGAPMPLPSTGLVGRDVLASTRARALRLDDGEVRELPGGRSVARRGGIVALRWSGGARDLPVDHEGATLVEWREGNRVLVTGDREEVTEHVDVASGLLLQRCGRGHAPCVRPVR